MSIWSLQTEKLLIWMKVHAYLQNQLQESVACQVDRR
jgi:hypothetical protein